MKSVIASLRYLPLILVAFALSACAPQQNGGLNGDAAGVPGTIQDFAANVGDTVLFDFDTSNIRPEGQDILIAQAGWLKQYPEYSVIIEGHTDARGTREYNLALGQRRAVSVRNFLKSKGIAPERIKTVSYGKERPVAACDAPECWSKNRRTVTILVSE